MQALKNFIQHPSKLGASIVMRYGSHLPDEVYLMRLFRFRLGYRLDLKKPLSYNEKLNWMKLYDRRPEYIMMVDKYAVKKYVASIVGEEHIIPTIGIWDKPEDIDFEKLPKSFVLKTTHGGGSTGVIIVRDKISVNFENIVKSLKDSLAFDMYGLFREWPYKNVPKRILVEQYIEPDKESNDLPDYKFFCFDGEVKALFVATERQKAGEDVKFDFFDADYNHLPFKQGHEHAAVLPPKPKHFEEMKEIAARISKGYPQMRVDLYDVNGHIYFGEITIFHFGAMTPFEPREWDYKFGNWLTLPNRM